MNRRRFLKHAGATSAIVGASALGLDFLVGPQSNPKTGLTISSTSPTSQASSTKLPSTTKTQLASLHGRLFFDYNGNGKQDGDEPAVSGARVQLKNTLGNVVAEASTDSSGNFKIEYVPPGAYTLFPLADPRFRYMCRSADEFRSVSDGYPIVLNEPSSIDVGLMEGFMTSPFDSQPLRIFAYVDLDKRTGLVLDWQGGKHTYDLHSGTDGATGKAYAAAAGFIISAEDDWQNDPMLRIPGNRVIIFHPTGTPAAGYTTGYMHLGELDREIRRINIEDGRTLWLKGNMSALQRVRRGQMLGNIGFTGNNPDNVLHLHFEVNQPPWQTRGMYYDGKKGGWASGEVIDPYRWIGDGSPPSDYANPQSLWTKDNDPQFAMT
jgi:hypothetical protein